MTSAFFSPHGFHGNKLKSLWIVLTIVLALRFIHFSSAMHNPLNYQLGADEIYYLRFAQALSSGETTNTVEFAFMDPGYGYIAGWIFILFGENIFALYFVQILLDTFTAFCLILIGRELNHPRAGLLAGLAYGMTSTALLFSTAMLKTIWAANFLTVWVLCGLLLLRRRGIVGWLLFGLFCGYGIALRSTFLITAAASLLLLPWLQTVNTRQPLKFVVRRVGVYLIGLAIPLGLLVLRNIKISGNLSPMPNNSGIVLHHFYNPENPLGNLSLPSFVSYNNPQDIQRGYTAEAQRRLGRTLTPQEVNNYWKKEARSYILSHPLAVARNMLRKLAAFVAYPEIPSNRSLEQERMFSPILKIMPPPFGFLLALGMPGIAMLWRRDRRTVLAFIPVAIALLTATLFSSVSRFRFQCVPMLALGAGVFLDYLLITLKQPNYKRAAAHLSAACALGAVSLYCVDPSQMPLPAPDKVAWGYYKMGDLEEAKRYASRTIAAYPDNPALHELLGRIALSEQNYRLALEYYRRAAQIKPDSHLLHYRLALLLSSLGMRDEAVVHATAAVKIRPIPEYLSLLRKLSSEE